MSVKKEKGSQSCGYAVQRVLNDYLSNVNCYNLKELYCFSLKGLGGQGGERRRQTFLSETQRWMSPEMRPCNAKLAFH